MSVVTLSGFGWTGSGGGGGGTITGANNGLSVSGGVTIQLGGALIQNTVIDFGAFNFGFDNFTTSDSNRYIVSLNASGDIEAFDATSLVTRGAIIQDVSGVFTQQLFIGDASNNTSVDYVNRILYDPSERVAFDWNNRMLYSYTLSQILSIDYQNRDLFDNTGITALNWSDRTLYDSTEVAIMDWQTASASGLELKNIGSLFTVSLLNTLLTGNRSYEFPNVSGTLTVNGFMQGGNSFGALAVLGTNDAFGLSFETNNTEWARFLTTGEFGIGLTTPTAKLQVRGTTVSSGEIIFRLETSTPTTEFEVDDYGNMSLGNTIANLNATLGIQQSSNKTTAFIVYEASGNFPIISAFSNGGTTAGDRYVTVGFKPGNFGTLVAYPFATANYGCVTLNGSSSSSYQLFSNLGGAATGSYAMGHIGFIGASNRGFVLDQELAGNMRIYMTDSAGTTSFSFQSDSSLQIIAGLSTQLLGVGTSSVTGKITIAAGTTTVAPLVFITGTLMTTSTIGSFEYASTRVYFTPYTSGNRHQVKTKRNLTVTAAGTVTLTVDDELCLVNQTVGAAIQINLPASPSDQDECTIADGKGDAATNNITVGRNGQNIEGAAVDQVINVNLQSMTFRFITGYGWKII